MLKEPRIYEVVRFKQRFLKNEEEILPRGRNFLFSCQRTEMKFVLVAEKLNIDESKE